ncbi:MAG: DUF4190 domain-containing protein [Acidobacteria bacterium]|nr:DUF4190 domain-containing protein [Acidobacteriota bacterium]
MKRCPRCGQTYTDGDINFCLNDGELLSRLTDAPGQISDDPPPTIMMDRTRVTDQTRWQAPSSPPAPYQSPSPFHTGVQQNSMLPYAASPDKTLAVVSLGLGVASLTIGWCCYLGLFLGPAAAITGLIAMSQIKKNPEKYDGRGFALAGVITGVLALVGYVAFFVIYFLLLMASS